MKILYIQYHFLLPLILVSPNFDQQSDFQNYCFELILGETVRILEENRLKTEECCQ
jgi:hypothetical protein